jgi:hypothetical protein
MTPILKAFCLLMTMLVPLQSIADKLRVPIQNTTDARVDWYFDTNRTAGSKLDWNGGTKTYDQHQGTDINRNPPSGCAHKNGSNWCDFGDIVVAASSGTVTRAVNSYIDHPDGCDLGKNTFDQCGNFGNEVRIKNSDGTITQYAHLLQGSIKVSVGETIACGQEIGRIGTSGATTGPHLHFGVMKNSKWIDPFSKNISFSLWANQGDYRGLPSNQGCLNKALLSSAMQILFSDSG